MFLKSAYTKRVKIIVLCVALIIGLVVFWLSFLPSATHLENRVFDLFLQHRPPQDVSDKIVIIFIDGVRSELNLKKIASAIKENR